MKNKEKQPIESKNATRRDNKDLMELCKLLLENWDGTVINVAKTVLEHYQPKLPKDSVVLSREEYQKDFSSQFNKGYKHGCKDTAEKVINWFKENSICIPSVEYINEFAKQFGVEIKEN